MLTKETQTEIKRVFSLNDYEVKLWSSLLARGKSTAGELSELSSVPRSRTYDVLEGLEKKGFVISQIAKPMTYIANHPEEILNRHKEDLKKELNNKLDQLNTHKKTKTFQDILTLYEKKGSKMLENSNVSLNLKGRQNIYSRLSHLFLNAKKEILLQTNQGGLSRKNYELIPSLEDAKKRGVNIRIISPDTETVHAKDYQKFAKLKKSKDFELRFVIIDNDKTMLLTNTGKSLPQHENALLLNNPFISEEFKKIFETHWKQ